MAFQTKEWSRVVDGAPDALRSSDAMHASRRWPWAAIVSTLAGNVASGLAYWWGWIGVGDLLWTYWLQSVAIGVFNAARMLSLKDFSTEGFTSNGSPVPVTRAALRGTVVFFVFHYGFFHFVYAIFLAVDFVGKMQHAGKPLAMPESAPLPGPSSLFGGTAFAWIAINAAFFFVAEGLTFLRQRRIDRNTKPNLGSLMFRPYLRIVPMHLTIIFGAATGLAVWIFLPLKTLADLGLQLVDAGIDRSAKRGALAEARVAK